MRSESEAVRRITENPFLVLELPSNASRADVERAGARLLGMLAVGLPGADTYETPLGPRMRDGDAIRAAMAGLRDPELRVRHELWVLAPASIEAAPIECPEPFDALAALGWSDR